MKSIAHSVILRSNPARNSASYVAMTSVLAPFFFDRIGWGSTVIVSSPEYGAEVTGPSGK